MHILKRTLARPHFMETVANLGETRLRDLELEFHAPVGIMGTTAFES
jgi:hypothetical protein